MNSIVQNAVGGGGRGSDGQTAADRAAIRELARRYREVCEQPIQEERRRLWRAHNSLKPTRPLIYLRGGNAWAEVPEIGRRETRDPFLQAYERDLRFRLYWASLGDDSIFEPWLTVPSVQKARLMWGVAIDSRRPAEAGGAWKHDPPLKDLRDLSGLVPPRHAIDAAATAARADRLRDALGDILAVHVERRTDYHSFNADLSHALGMLRGIEQIMFDMTDDPDGLHRLMAFLRDGVLAVQGECEAAGDWRLGAHENQAMPYAEELADPRANGPSVTRDKLWGFAAAQEFAVVSPGMHDEFLFQYQKPILEKFGLVAYGCCEDLTRKIPMLRRLKNLRRIAVSPMADVRACAEGIGTDYVISWRPSPADTVCCGFDPDRIRRLTRAALAACRGRHMDITLKDVHTVCGEPDRLREWVRIVRACVDERSP